MKKENILRNSLLKGAYKLAVCIPIFSIFFSSINKENKEINKLENNVENLIESTDEFSEKMEEIQQVISHRRKELQEIMNSIQNQKTISKAQDKRIEEYLKLLEKLGKTQKEYQQMKDNLKKVEENLNVSPYEETLYSDSISIGDELFVVDDFVPIYGTDKDLILGTNYKTSYYKTREIRLVSKIVMTKDYMIVEIDNMEDYELFKSMGFSVAGYIVVNQYSLEEDGNLEIEGRYEENGVELVHKLRKKSHKLPEQDIMI